MNLVKFETVLQEKKVTKADLAKLLKKDRATIYRRFAKGGESFTVSEVSKISHFLELTSDETNSIFFDEKAA